MGKLNKTVFIIHGTPGHPEETWFPWLKYKLELLGHNVIVPQFPTPENQKPAKWFDIFDQYKEDLTQDAILVAHSPWGALPLRIPEQSNIQIADVFFVATIIGICPIKNMEAGQPFIRKPFVWEKIKSKAGRFVPFHSDNGPAIGVANGIEIAKIWVQNLFAPLIQAILMMRQGIQNLAASWLYLKNLKG